MTRKTLSVILLVLAAQWLTACSTLSSISTMASPETSLFAEGLDQFIDTGDLTMLKTLPDEYPDGSWRPRAEAIITLAEQRKTLDRDLVNRSHELDRCLKDKDLVKQDNQALEQTLERLKQVLIDMERQKN
ncbi:MAG: hypothetical protein JRE16_05975 [Deltaproteobacteria bacterium]|jgi:hypothetical protein|nr:hypothetical protein [Deltaproteobacteria bacterium]MBW2476785.1 hypothetical protein [Deltaproteobacteria bacterium]MBW2504102.1 hypothetical protein [Deltaproteobacteria bacterium]